MFKHEALHSDVFVPNLIPNQVSEKLDSGRAKLDIQLKGLSEIEPYILPCLLRCRFLDF